MKTVKLLAFALLVSSVSFAQTKKKAKNTAKAVTVAPAVVAPGAPAVVATPAAQVPQTPSQLKWEKETHEFGTIEQGKPVSYEFTFTNTTNKDVTLTNVKASCGCTATNYTKTAIKPGEKGTVTATYNASAGGAFHKTGLLVANQVEKVSGNYFTVNVNYEFENTVLEHYLISEFQKNNLDVDFEYAVYNCTSDQMAFSNHINSNGKKEPIKCPTCFIKNPEYTYYFAIRFPDIEQNYFKNLNQYWIFTSVLFLVLIIYVYSVLLMLKQKKYTELQKDFINNMSHEFKTPLASILIASNYAKQQNEIKQNPKLMKYNQIIVNQTNKLNEHIEKILYVAKTESKQMLIDKTQFVLKPVLDLVKDNILLKYDKEIDIQINLAKPFKIKADEFHIYNILFNLVDNAVKYSDDSPKIEIDVVESNNQLCIQVKDNGCGIPAKDLPFVFDKFYRVSRKDISNIEGFGIGLSYVKKICELHHWKIGITNNSDKGITVTIQINPKDYV